MQREILSILIWTFAFGVILSRASNKHGVIEGKIYKFHIFFSWLLIMLHYTAFRMLGWATGNYNEITKHFFVTVGPVPAWLNLSTWASNLIFSLFAITIAYMLAQRKELGRKYLIRTIPILYILAIIEAVKGYYLGTNETAMPLTSAILIFSSTIAIPFGAIYYFYNKNEVKTKIFNN